MRGLDEMTKAMTKVCCRFDDAEERLRNAEEYGTARELTNERSAPREIMESDACAVSWKVSLRDRIVSLTTEIGNMGAIERAKEVVWSNDLVGDIDVIYRVDAVFLKVKDIIEN
ncbi:hypothetical protein NL676_008212 [Syzygium grande]|nr:hypothetical protein NL676_008212 [Syzygium grande]